MGELRQTTYRVQGNDYVISNKVPVDPKTENNTSRKYSMEKTPYRVEHLLELGKVDQATQIAHGWNPHDKSVNIFVKGISSKNKLNNIK